ncbi:hypothetical protein EJA01_16560 [Rhodovulum iodosum]|uniref:hypothetical protein n=1 Tax=Rhodovulum iodosum TaxID=68291 RepID=UPI000F675B1A|nr:hypothetical protein [Rhodovulum robiginosum]RSK30399.1 hypothetical protein EJA01_16560 [Rhodovulum robiginosum]
MPPLKAPVAAATTAKPAQGGAGPAKPGGKAPPFRAAGPAKRRGRHVVLALSFLLVVVLPGLVGTGYLYTRAVDQYHSTVGFVVRKEEIGSAVELLGGISQLSGSSSSDTDILYEFIQSQQLVSNLDRQLDLRAMYSRPFETDPVFAFNPDGSIEDLVGYWGKMVKIFYDAGTGLIELRVLAFDADDAHSIAQGIFSESSEMINQLSAIARQDTTRYAREELERSVERLKEAREALSTFRSKTQIIDPQADVQGQMGLLNNLQQQLAASLIELDLLRDTTRDGDPRVGQAERRIEVIRQRIAEERNKFSVSGQGPDDEDYVAILGEFERLSVDREFAEQAYLAALAAFDSAQAEAQRKSRYLAAYIEPTLAERAQYPKRLTLSGLTILFLFLTWAMGTLVYYSVRDRR